MMLKHVSKGVCALIMLAASQSWANTSSLDIAANPDAGAINPIAVQAISGESEGNKFYLLPRISSTPLKIK